MCLSSRPEAEPKEQDIYGVFNILELQKMLDKMKKEQRIERGTKRLPKRAVSVFWFNSVIDSDGDLQLRIKRVS
tara:strand:- start:264 stop:485 length:222 start_codon:yes stop_codon:yes gene_type:complete